MGMSEFNNTMAYRTEGRALYTGYILCPQCMHLPSLDVCMLPPFLYDSIHLSIH